MLGAFEEYLVVLTNEFRLVFQVILWPIVIVGFIANVGVLYRICCVNNTNFKPFYRCSLISMALADLFLLGSSGINILSMIHHRILLWNLSDLSCIIIPYIQTIAVLVASLTLGGIAIDRYVAIKSKYLLSKGPSWILTFGIIFFIWTISAGAAYPVLNIYTPQKLLVINNSTSYTGEHFTTTYTHVLWATRARREHLLATKYFACSCDRCKDPTELNSNIGTLKCPCGPGLILAKDPLDINSEWSCNSCPGVLTSMEVHQLTERLGEEVENAMTTAKATVLSDLLSRLSILLHPGHQHCIAVSHSLIQLLSPEDPKKLELCKHILNTTSILDPYGTRLALYTAVALRELASCSSKDKKLHLERAIYLLKHEPPHSPGDELRKLIEIQLSK
ncbi:hypothetical protein PV327_007508 [Microctonus hyperodae]|uniref:G-protein coupled receptors family 1 profile domain-containing protein n=1 Tax=Microctonus hyperodae TaxID=165561 RepID=A0AA39KYS4_MICHY|nr:hypothetical protein PV327_007508 [Microctonus hyperodae]